MSENQGYTMAKGSKYFTRYIKVEALNINASTLLYHVNVKPFNIDFFLCMKGKKRSVIFCLSINDALILFQIKLLNTTAI